MRSKYRIPTSPIFWSGPQRCSPEWKELVAARLDFAQRCGWKIGAGDVSFWFDHWNEDFFYGELASDHSATEKLNELWDGNAWNFD